MFAVIYKIVGPDENKAYIGSTTLPLQKRLNNHRSDARTGVVMRLYEAMRSLGEKNFSIQELATVPIEERFVEEGRYIRELNAHTDGYNQLIPGRTARERRRAWRSTHPELVRAQRQRRAARLAERRRMYASEPTSAAPSIDSGGVNLKNDFAR